MQIENANPKPPPDPKSRIPLSIKLLILISIVFIAGLVAIYFWYYNFRKSLALDRPARTETRLPVERTRIYFWSNVSHPGKYGLSMSRADSSNQYAGDIDIEIKVNENLQNIFSGSSLPPGMIYINLKEGDSLSVYAVSTPDATGSVFCHITPHIPFDTDDFFRRFITAMILRFVFLTALAIMLPVIIRYFWKRRKSIKQKRPNGA